MFIKLSKGEKDLLQRMLDAEPWVINDRSGYFRNTILIDDWFREIDFRGLVEKDFLIDAGTDGCLRLSSNAINYSEMEEAYMKQDTRSGDIFNNVTFNNDVKDTQIQVGSTGGTQTLTVNNGLEHDRIIEVLANIIEVSHSKNFKDGTDADGFKSLILETIKMVEERKDDNAIKKSLSILKNMAEKVLVNVVASGVISQINEIGQFIG